MGPLYLKGLDTGFTMFFSITNSAVASYRNIQTIPKGYRRIGWIRNQRMALSCAALAVPGVWNSLQPKSHHRQLGINLLFLHRIFVHALPYSFTCSR
jgi:hypothetical protein